MCESDCPKDSRQAIKALVRKQMMVKTASEHTKVFIRLCFEVPASLKSLARVVLALSGV